VQVGSRVSADGNDTCQTHGCVSLYRLKPPRKHAKDDSHCDREGPEQPMPRVLETHIDNPYTDHHQAQERAHLLSP
jgi:hypothetical protein